MKAKLPALCLLFAAAVSLSACQPPAVELKELLPNLAVKTEGQFQIKEVEWYCGEAEVLRTEGLDETSIIPYPYGGKENSSAIRTEKRFTNPDITAIVTYKF